MDGVGFMLPNQDPEAIGRGDAFTATADDPAALYYNPAGITQLPGTQASIGIYAISPSTKYESPTGQTASTDSRFQEVPQIYATTSLTNIPISLGLGVYVPYGLSLDWGVHAPFAAVAQSGSLLYACVNPVIAWKVCPTLSIAAGATINYSDAEFDRALTVFPTLFKFTGNGWGYGYNAGILWQPLDQWSFGVNYRSSTRIMYDGNILAYPVLPETSASTEIKFPQYVTVGASYRPTTNWNFEVDVNWADWDVVNTLTFHDVYVGNPSLPLHMRSSFIYQVGGTRQLGNGYYVSLGYMYSEKSNPDTYFTPLIPDANLHLGNIGFGHKGKRWDWAVAYQFAYNGGRTVENNAFVLPNGEYKTFNNAFNVSTTFKF
jgi:long-chain fatty acid transport protein